ncbi:hypothetical protein ACLQ22_11890 [Micromonospora sp. DT178]|uniref:hypothetical protein n=1 Tax=Micromonospora sp. DT178 TaxID=3393436 RepID=UPI003CF61D41
MRFLRNASLVLALVFGLGLAAPAPASAHHNYSTQCATGRVESLANNLPLRYEPNINAAVYTWAQMGYQYNCSQFDPIVNDGPGTRYTACGHTNANGWIVIKFGGNVQYFTYMTCLKDV